MGRENTEGVAGGKKRVVSKNGSREKTISTILDRLETQLLKADVKGTVADYLRLIQVMKEMGEERPREIEIRWVNSLREENGR